MPPGYQTGQRFRALTPSFTFLVDHKHKHAYAFWVMSTRPHRQHLRLTSAAPGVPPSRPSGEAINRAFWQQSQTLFGAHSRARDIHGTDNQLAKQRALCEELERIATEAHHLLETLESLPPESEAAHG